MKKPLGSYDITDLRYNISFVTQDSYFLDASIRENIIISGLKLSDEKILNELDRVFGNQFEQNFPKKLDTAVGLFWSQFVRRPEANDCSLQSNFGG